MPVSTIATTRSAPSAEQTHETPAELPSGRASFGDEFGRETAFRDSAAPASATTTRDEPEPPALGATAETSRDERDAEIDADSIELLLAALCAPIPVAPQPALLTTSFGPSLAPPLAPTVDALAVSGALAPVERELAPSLPRAAAPPAGSKPVGGFAASGLTDDLGAAALVAEDGAALPSDGVEGSAAAALRVVAQKDGASAVESADAALDVRAAAWIDQLHVRELAPPAAEPKRAEAAIERVVTLPELPRTLRSEIDGFLRVRGQGRHWEAEIRLDPPELGSLHVKLELRGHALHGVVRVEDPRLEPTLDRMLKELEQSLREQGGDASFDLFRGAREGGEGWAQSSSADAWKGEADGDVRRPEVVRGAGPDAARLVDLFA